MLESRDNLPYDNLCVYNMFIEGGFAQSEEYDLKDLTVESHENIEGDNELTQEPRQTDDLIGLYFGEAAQLPLLTHEQEIDLAKRIEAGRFAATELSTLIREDVAVSRGKTEVLNATIADGLIAKDIFVRSNLRLVISVAKKYLITGADFGDLIQDGNIGLLRAVQRFDYRLGNRFSTYATWWIRQAITREIANKNSTIRIPVHVYDRISSITSFINRFELEHGRVPSDREIMGSLGVSERNIKEFHHVIGLNPVSLDVSANNDDDVTELGYFVIDPSAIDPLEAVQTSDTIMRLEEILAGALTVREIKIVLLRSGFGSDDGEPVSLQKIGEMYGLSRERVRQIESEAMGKLKHPMFKKVFEALR